MFNLTPRNTIAEEINKIMEAEVQRRLIRDSLSALIQDWCKRSGLDTIDLRFFSDGSIALTDKANKGDMRKDFQNEAKLREFLAL